MKKRLIVISSSKNPYLNHAVEETLFSTFVDYEQILFLWVNGPTVVMGRNQNPWREVDVQFIESHDVALIRRLSGGGTVYHDEGNLNYAFISSQSVYDESHQFKIIQDALGHFKLQTWLSKRKDLSIDGYKISGSAFYMKGMRRIHHGTLLIDADLERLSNSLKASDENFKKRFLKTKSIASVPSQVMNLKTLIPELTVADVINAIVDVFYKSSDYQVDVMAMDEVIKAHEPIVEKHKARHASWQWVFGETPNFTFQSATGQIYEVSNGKVTPEGDINLIF